MTPTVISHWSNLTYGNKTRCKVATWGSKRATCLHEGREGKATVLKIRALILLLLHMLFSWHLESFLGIINGSRLLHWSGWKIETWKWVKYGPYLIYFIFLFDRDYVAGDTAPLALATNRVEIIAFATFHLMSLNRMIQRKKEKKKLSLTGYTQSTTLIYTIEN